MKHHVSFSCRPPFLFSLSCNTPMKAVKFPWEATVQCIYQTRLYFYRLYFFLLHHESGRWWRQLSIKSSLLTSQMKARKSWDVETQTLSYALFIILSQNCHIAILRDCDSQGKTHSSLYIATEICLIWYVFTEILWC